MSKMKVLLIALLAGAAWISTAWAAKPDTYWVCHNDRLLEVVGKHALMAHFRHGDILPTKDGVCP